ncbi:MAK10-like protein [Tanacetum coccineum]
MDQSAGGKLRGLNAEESWALLEDLALYDNKSWNDPRDFAKLVKAITLPQDVPSTFDRRIIELENQVQRLMEAHLALAQHTQVNKISTSCEIYSGPHDTQYCMEDPEQAFVEYASSLTDEARGKCSYPTNDPQCSTQIHSLINAITIHPKQQIDSRDDRTEKNKEEQKESPENTHPDSSTPPDPSIAFINEKVIKFNSLFESLGSVPLSPNAELVCTKEGDGDVMFIEKGVKSHITSILCAAQSLQYFYGTPIIIEGCTSNLKIPCNIGHAHVEKAYIDLNSPLNIMTRMMYNWIMRRKLDPKGNANGGVGNFTRRIKGMHVFIGNFTYVVNFMIVEDISSIIDLRLSQVVLGRPFVEISNMTHDPPKGVVRFIRGADEVAYKMPHKIEQYESLLDLEK